MSNQMGAELIFILSQISVGRKNAVTYKELAQRTRWNSRAIQMAVEELAKKWKIQEDQARRDNAMPGEVTLGL